MTALEDFETLLKDVVQAKRLSVSKMTKLTEIALKSMKEDTSLVSILYRTHKSLRPAAKISSLYVFDALSRAARSQVNKHGLAADSSSGKGNTATFLLKIEGVLEGLFQDMVSLEGAEPKEKTRKILDIWVKGNTFPPSILSRLKDIIEGIDKEPAISVVPTADPRNNSVTPVAPEPPVAQAPPVPADPQATLLALLTQAASAMVPGVVSQTPANTQSAQAPLAPQQLALLQQLTQSVKAPNGSAPILAISNHLNGAMAVDGPSAVPARSPSLQRDDYSASSRRMHESDRYDVADSSPYDAHFRGNYSSSGRGSSTRGGFHARGRGDGKGRWDDHDRFRDRDRSPPRRPRRSRSRSPPSRHGGRRDVKPYSPPRRPSLAAPPSKPASGKDEFGRDIRSESPTPPKSTPLTATPAATPTAPSLSTASPVDPTPSLTNSNQLSASLAVDGDAPGKPPVPADESSSAEAQDNSHFNWATFDPSSPASWEALGKWWQVTYGYAPSTEELMQFMMGNTMYPMGMMQPGPGWSQPSWQGTGSMTQQSWRGGRGGGFARGRGGGYAHGGNPRVGQEQWDQGHGASMDTDAIVLGGGDGGGGVAAQTVSGGNYGQPNKDPSMGNSAAPGGRMQRVGDKWLFVKGDGATAHS
ncbi:hypothetical protein HGRIS_005035 [Hohenbuehelia grisea]|uniref:CID domain-containing protein n=1 Tax=Hohenbuehelia grisea TaxID=104357 RepID=A0ABR3JFE5_9AGAR